VLVYGSLPPARLQLRPWWVKGRRRMQHWSTGPG
jgi:hypothetical protein